MPKSISSELQVKLKMGRKAARAKFEDDNNKLLAQYFGAPISSNSIKNAREMEESRREKWRLSMRILDWRIRAIRNPEALKRRIRLGVTNSLRSVVWQFISGGRDLLLANTGIYNSMLLDSEISQKSEKLILQDVHRTLPSLELFQTIDGPWHRSLHNVLKAYSAYDTEVGYTQGMNFMAGMLLSYMSEEEAFWALVGLFKDPGIRRVYLDGLPLLHQYFFQFEMLVKEKLPALGKHFEEQMIRPDMYASSWFMTVFSADLPFPLAARIWDVFLHEGMETVFRVGLALLNFLQDDLLKLPFENLLSFLRGFPKESLDANTLMPIACSLKLTKRLQKLEKDYQEDQTTPDGWTFINANSKRSANDPSISTENGSDEWILINPQHKLKKRRLSLKFYRKWFR